MTACIDGRAWCDPDTSEDGRICSECYSLRVLVTRSEEAAA